MFDYRSEFSVHLLQHDIARLHQFDPKLTPFRLGMSEFGCDKGMKLVHNKPGSNLMAVWADLQEPQSRMYKPTTLDYEPNEDRAADGAEYWIERATREGLGPAELEDVLDRTFPRRGNLAAPEALKLVAERNWVWFSREPISIGCSPCLPAGLR